MHGLNRFSQTTSGSKPSRPPALQSTKLAGSSPPTARRAQPTWSEVRLILRWKRMDSNVRFPTSSELISRRQAWSDKRPREPEGDFDDRQCQVYRAPSQAGPGNDIHAGSPSRLCQLSRLLIDDVSAILPRAQAVSRMPSAIAALRMCCQRRVAAATC